MVSWQAFPSLPSRAPPSVSLTMPATHASYTKPQYAS